MSNRPSHIVREDSDRVEAAYLVEVRLPGDDPEEASDLLDELAELVQTLGIRITGRSRIRIREFRSRFLVGSGKAREVAEAAHSSGADVIVIDNDLTPSQQRNWEQLTELAVIDRHEVILDIFARRAHTREAVLQVALARANYDLPRLKRRWTHLSRQRGMTGGTGGLRGAGEQQIEVDARLIGARIAHLKKKLGEVRKQRRTQRSRRLKRPVPLGALVGYTNAGKSSLLNRLTDSDVFVEDKLFATLDPTVRRVVLPNRQELLLSDTVGFIRNLPHMLIEAFRATLEETFLADMLIEVIDVTSSGIEEHHRTTRAVLEELGVDVKSIITVFNKVDLLEDPLTVRRIRRHHPGAHFTSARTGVGIEELLQELSRCLDARLSTVTFLIPHDRYDLVAKLHRSSDVKQEKHLDEGTEITASVPDDVLPSFTEFMKRD